MRDMAKLHPRLQKKAAQLKEACSKQGISIQFGEGLRTPAEQEALYAQGRTAPGPIVTNAKGNSYSSQHQWGIAVDFYLNMDVDGDGAKSDDAYNNNTGLFDRVGNIAKSIGLGWGGDWVTIKDRPHLYLPDWGSQTSSLKQQYGTPEKFMSEWGDANLAAAAIEAVTGSSAKGYVRTQFIMDVQACTGSKVDGKAGNETLRNTVTVSETVNQKHAVVLPLQKRLNALGYDCGKADGIAGTKFTSAVNAYQKKVLGYTNTDGQITARKNMWKSLLGMI